MNFITRCYDACKSNIIIKVNPDLNYFRSYVESIPQTFDSAGETIRCVRNHIKVFEVDGKRINVKKYTIPPYFFNCFIYVLFRDPKAKRHYDYALRLKSLGFDSPTPIGYYLEKKGLLLSHCYLATEQKDDIYPLSDLKYFYDSISTEDILSEFGRYTAMLHNKGVFHGDYTLGNILFCVEDNQFKFALVDINRMNFHKVTFNIGCKNFHRLDLNPQHLKIVANAYAEAMNYDKEETYDKITYYRNRKKMWGKCKRWYKSLLNRRKANVEFNKI